MYNLMDNDLVICNSVYKKKILLDMYEEKKLLNIKFMTLDEFKNNYFYTYSSDALYYLHKIYNLDVDVAREYLDNIIYDYEPLKDIYNYLKDNDLLIYNNYFKDEIKNKRIVIIGNYVIDDYLMNVFNKYNCLYYNNIDSNCNNSVFEFDNDVEEVNYVINDIIDKKLDLNKVYLVNADNYKSLLKRMSLLYNIPINIDTNRSIYSTKVVQDFLYDLRSSLSYQDALDKIKNNEIKKSIIKVINKYSVNLDEYLIDVIDNELKYVKISVPMYKEGINLININDVVDDSNTYYILGFNYGIIPRVETDDLLIKDIDRPKLGLKTSLERMIINKDIIKKIIKYKNVIITYKNKDNMMSYEPSLLIKECNLDVVKINDISFNHSNLFNKLMYGIYLDNLSLYNEYNSNIPRLMATYDNYEYNTYDNKYNNINYNSLKEYLNGNITLSYSSMNNYYNCPFKFYINNILKLDPFEDTFQIFVGNLFHDVLSHMYDDDFDVDKAYNNYLSKHELSNKEKYFTNKLFDELKRVIDVIKYQDKHSKFSGVETEKRINIDKSHDLSVNFIGFIDKIKYLEKDNTLYLSIIDYKTGNVKITLDNINYGLNLQLPTYIYLVNKGIHKRISIAGFYLQKILNNKELDSDNIDEDMRKKLRLDGYTIDDEELIELFDDTYSSSDVIYGMGKTKNGFSSYAKLISNDDINKLSKLVDNLINKLVLNIENTKFDIAPVRINDEVIGCKYCKYKDICFRKEEDIVNLVNMKKDDILEGDLDGMD